MQKIAVIGSLNVDYVANVPHMPVVGETILAKSFSIVPGGKGANQAFAIGRMGGPVLMFGAVGCDENGALELSRLESAGVDVTCVRRVDAPTGLAMITVNTLGDNCIVVAQGANLAVTREYIDEQMERLMECDIIVFQLEIPLDTVVYAAQTLKKMGKTVILDPAPAPDHLPDELLSSADYLKPNETELARLVGFRAEPERVGEACELLLGRGVGCVLASLGSAGVMVCCSGESGRLFQAGKAEAVDTTAAGDSFTAAVAYALANGKDVFDAAQFATKVADIVVQRPGAQSSIPETAEIRELWERLFDE